ncbi:RidA family protein [Bradyrhizobium tropiciagri]|uniref:RidA family protein n=1 Tax=Bradyrhizobium tropiciagri TaxID=312253 RepID=UPI001BA958CD|nr:RidA family protein [Bradyrhizobium tropiciagri]MBR0896738.1 RidA family protein [Bradyrhizobium tropiciagri]
MNKKFDPIDIAPPFNNIYSHGVEVPPNSRTLWIAGQTGDLPDGTTPDSFEDQAEQAMKSFVSVLAGAGMTVSDVVKINVYLTSHADLEKFRPIRSRHLDGHRPAMTLAVVSTLAEPKWKIEVEGVAAKQ